ncbi:deoxyuridine 5'-triphosphate nucleotidohydrolase, mitochondrial isoform X2 [Patella vulgata]|uniref:deoxyuridine 5'-triphosphate nucleotidohydrolase, mitochondrial isoform X2 n=1 Tax=Patella vulgata TaxID=6465 RepID=UPI0024A7F518|nr:deoxyuridine 5'-triphosphate nucleotidohydrolase, mitochondrial isoform X2 [Patella vulgata]
MISSPNQKLSLPNGLLTRLDRSCSSLYIRPMAILFCNENTALPPPLAYNVTVPSKGKAVVKTDIQIALPDGCYGRVAPRSGLAVKHFIDVGAGVIDQDYRGNVGVVMFNFSDTDFQVNEGDRIAQLICERIYIPELQEQTSLDDTDRGSGGFGSTGKK